MYFDIAWYEITFKDSLQVPPIPQMVQQQSQNYQRHCLEYPSPDNKGCSGSSDIFVSSGILESSGFGDLSESSDSFD